MDAVRADLLARWPIEPDRILVTGFSQGGSMVWDLACRRGSDYGAFAAVSGAFWEPLPERCAGGPVDLLHIHGTTDRTVPMAGPRRSATNGARATSCRGCGAARARRLPDRCPARRPSWPGWRARPGTTAASGRELRLCEHGGGHFMPEGWVALAHAWARGLHARSQGG